MSYPLAMEEDLWHCTMAASLVLLRPTPIQISRLREPLRHELSEVRAFNDRRFLALREEAMRKKNCRGVCSYCCSSIDPTALLRCYNCHMSSCEELAIVV